MQTRILPCDCTHQYQDARYGTGRRVHNRGKQIAVGKYLWRCTVCGKTR